MVLLCNNSGKHTKNHGKSPCFMGNIPKTMENHPVLWVNQRMGKLKLDFREYINGFWKNQQENCRVLPGREGWSYVIPKRQLSILPATSVGNNYAYESMPTMAIDVLLKWQICKNFPEKVVRWQSKPSSDINLGVIFTGHRHQNPPKTSNICDICDGKQGKPTALLTARRVLPVDPPKPLA